MEVVYLLPSPSGDGQMNKLLPCFSQKCCFNSGDPLLQIAGHIHFLENDINLNSSAWAHGYLINKKFILSTPGTRNTLVGINAGNPNIGSYLDNVLVGYDAGANLTTGFANTFMGASAGHDNETSIYNTFIGKDAGYSHQYGEANTFIGRNAGLSDQSGAFNTFVGEQSGQTNISGINNSFFGHHSGFNCTGSDNTYIGQHAALAPVSFLIIAL